MADIFKKQITAKYRKPLDSNRKIQHVYDHIQPYRMALQSAIIQFLMQLLKEQQTETN